MLFNSINELLSNLSGSLPGSPHDTAQAIYQDQLESAASVPAELIHGVFPHRSYSRDGIAAQVTSFSA